jgi:hypothetical protein
MQLSSLDYVQTHKEHSNNMDQRTMGCNCLGPTGNQQGGHWFILLASGEQVSRHQWTELPIPREAINHVSMIGCCQGMPDMITYANRQGCEIGDTVEDYLSDDDNDNKSYQDSANNQMMNLMQRSLVMTRCPVPIWIQAPVQTTMIIREAMKNPRSKLGWKQRPRSRSAKTATCACTNAAHD